MPDPIAAPEALTALFTLFLLEIALGLENALLIGFGVSELPGDARKRTRRFGFILALGMRLVLVGLLVWVLSMPERAIPFSPWAITWHDLVLFAGGVFLIHRAVSEIDDILSGEKGRQVPMRPRAAAVSTLVGMALVSVVLAMDTALLAVGVTSSLPIMALAIIFAWVVMVFLARPLGRLLATFPAIRLLALGILLLVGGTLMARGLGYQVPLVAVHLVTLAVAIVGAGYAASASMRGRAYSTLRVLPPILVPEHAFRPAMERAEPDLDLGPAIAEPSETATPTEHAGDIRAPEPEPAASSKPRHPGLERETEPLAPEVIEPMVMPPSMPAIESERAPRGDTPQSGAQDRDEDALFAAPYDAWPAETATRADTEGEDDPSYASLPGTEDTFADEHQEETDETFASDGDDLMDGAGGADVEATEEAPDASEPQPALVEAQEPVPKADGKTRQKVRKPVRRRRAASRRGKR